MRTLTYTVSESAVPGLLECIRAVFDALAERDLPVRYAATRHADSATFTHVVDTGSGSETLDALPQFAAFQEYVRAHLLDGPHIREVTVLGASAGWRAGLEELSAAGRWP